MASLADLQHEAGYRGDSLVEVNLLGVAVKDAVQRLTELDELPLWSGERGTYSGDAIRSFIGFSAI